MPAMTEPKRKRGRPAAQNDVEPFQLQAKIDGRLGEAIDKFAEATRLSKKAIYELALEAFLTKKGFWPPPAE
jgi:hypothetical protein